MKKYKKIEVPLTIRFPPHGEFRLEPSNPVDDVHRFSVSFKFYKSISLSGRAAIATAISINDIEEYIKTRCQLLFRDAQVYRRDELDGDLK